MLEIIIPLVVGYLLDLLLGDPRQLPHPVVGFGKIIGWCERHFNQGEHRKIKGCLIAILLPAGTLVCGLAIARGAWLLHPGVYYTVASIAVFYGLANRSLIQEGQEVIQTLENKGLEAGRKRLSWIVGRDTSQLPPRKIYTAVLETMAENLSDGVVAPLFFYAIGGFPAMLTYKMVNTLDSMIGYKSPRYKDFGCCSARLDDVLNYLPARITALLMAMVSYRPRTSGDPTYTTDNSSRNLISGTMTGNYPYRTSNWQQQSTNGFASRASSSSFSYLYKVIYFEQFFFFTTFADYN